MNHDRNKLRVLNWAKALRKQRICREIYGSDFYDNLHQYHKNKIHCSCPNCRGEDSHLGKNSPANQTLSNQKKLIKMKEPLEDFYEDNQ